MGSTTEDRPTAISEFIIQCIETAGGATEYRSSTLLDVLLPAGLTFAAGDRPLVTLALNPDPLGAQSDREPATIGSTFVDALIEYAARRGTTGVGRLAPGVLKRKGLKEVFERCLVFSNCRVRFDDGSVRVRDMYYAVFEFRLTFVSDERRERLVTVPVDLWSNTINPRLAEALPLWKVLPAEPPEAGNIPSSAIQAAYERAKEAIRERASAESLIHQSRLLKRFEVECSRIGSYYHQIQRDMEHRAAGEQDDTKRATLRQKIAGAETEAQTKQWEIAEKYRISPKAALVNARLITQEKTFFKLAIDRGSVTRELELSYDSLLEQLDLPPCDRCHRPTARLHVNDAAERLCPGCSGKS